MHAVETLTTKKSRIAPTPSGYLHEGNVLNFVLTWLHIRSMSGLLHLRIDDADSERVRPEYVQDIFDVLNWLELDYDTGPRDYADFKFNHSQLLRKERYEGALVELEKRQLLFKCSCSRSQISARNHQHEQCIAGNFISDLPYAMRLNTAQLAIHSGSGSVQNLHALVPYPILRKKDGFAAYNICSLIDDVDMGVNYIVRGEDLLHQSLLQKALAEILGFNAFNKATFIHHPLLTDSSGQKLSKSAGLQKQSLITKYATPRALLAALPFQYPSGKKPNSLLELLLMHGETGNPISSDFI